MNSRSSTSVGTDNLADESRHSLVSDQALTSSAGHSLADRVVGSSLEVRMLELLEHDWEYLSDVLRVCTVCDVEQERDMLLSGMYENDLGCGPCLVCKEYHSHAPAYTGIPECGCECCRNWNRVAEGGKEIITVDHIECIVCLETHTCDDRRLPDGDCECCWLEVK
jgi:hypothetical protein